MISYKNSSKAEVDAWKERREIELRKKAEQKDVKVAVFMATTYHAEIPGGLR